MDVMTQRQVLAKVFTTLYKMKDSTISSKLQAAFWKSNAESSYRDSLLGDVKRIKTMLYLREGEPIPGGLPPGALILISPSKPSDGAGRPQKGKKPLPLQRD